MCSRIPDRAGDWRDVPQSEAVSVEQAAEWMRKLAETPCADARAWHFHGQPEGIGGHRLTRRPFLKFFLAGSARLRDARGETVRVMQPGELAYFPPGTYSNIHYTGPVRFFRVTLLQDMTFFAWSEITEVKPDSGDQQSGRLRGISLTRRPSGLTRALLSRLERWSGAAAAAELWPVLCREWVEQLHAPEMDGRARERARHWEILRYLEENAHEPINRKSTAQALGLSVGHVSRVFRRAGEDNFNTALLRLRLEHAKALLRKGNLPVSEIAPRCGFTSANYFAQVFRRVEGLSPQAWKTEEKH
ncbi:helix-turn-helix domain-containing protein [Rariglobus hedericola]|uniref:Helix-turn-helix domain-containing protein n=1 Tax=Rariglobus hedericola TaxID=2597822 RepID=A0A556QPI1_9BACT|nr:helix-turn-helix domain-containing protein [Rariglobus hedericola]